MGDEKDRTLWVGNLSDRATEELLFELFLQAGPLEKVKIPLDTNGKSKRFAFITFKHSCSVPYTIELMNGVELFGNQLRLQTRSGSTHNSTGSTGSPSAYNPRGEPQRGEPQHRSPQYGSSMNSPGAMQRSNTWHGQDMSNQVLSGQANIQGQQVQGYMPQGHNKSRDSGSNSPGVFDRSGQSDVIQFDNPHWNNNGGGGGQLQSQNSDPISMQIRRERILQQQNAMIEAHRMQQQAPPNPYSYMTQNLYQQRRGRQQQYRRY